VKVIKAVYNFLVGDMIILVGILITVVILTLILDVPGLQSLKVISGVILIVAILTVLTTTLLREALGNK